MILLATVLRGLRSRALLSAGSVLLTALAVGSALLGPSFQQAVTNSYAITRLDAVPDAVTGISRVLTPDAGLDVATAQERAVAAVAGRDAGPWVPPATQVETLRYSALRGVVAFWTKDGACDHLEIEGRCPQAPGEVLMLAADAAQTGAEVGADLPMNIFEPSGVGQLGLPRSPLPTVRVVGTYAAPGPAEEDFWFNRDRLATVSERETLNGGYTPYTPAPLITVPETFEQIPDGDWTVRIDTRLDVTPDLTAAEVATAARAAAAVGEEPEPVDGGTLVGDPGLSDLAAVDAEIQQQRATASASIAPAVLSLVLVALALLLRLLMAASELRVAELALASLRGLPSSRLWTLGLAEPLALLAISVPVGAAVGAALAWGLARWWLVPGLPVPVPWESFAAAGLVLAAALAVAVVAVGLVVRVELSAQLAGIRRPGRRGRVTLLVELTLVALALAVLGSKLASSRQSDPDVTDLVLPVLLAVVAGLGATRLAAATARWWTGRRRAGSRARGLGGYVAARALSRRTEGTLVILPVTAAIAVAVFAAGVYGSAATWRGSVAAIVAPADTVWTSPLTMRETVELTERVDPDGEWVMAAASVTNPGASFAVVDTPRLPRVDLWPPTWSPGTGVEQVAERIDPPGAVPELTGRRLSITVDNRAQTSSGLVVEARLGTLRGRPVQVYLGPFPEGVSTQTARLPGCTEGCPLEGIAVGGGAGTTMVMAGDITLSDIEVDGEPVADVYAPAQWSPSSDNTAQPDGLRIALSDDAIDLGLDSDGAAARVRLVSGGLSAEAPVWAGVDVTDASLSALSENSDLTPVDPVGRLEGMPFVGPAGVLVDYRAFVLDRPVYDNLFRVRVLARDGVPADVEAALRAEGLSVQTTFAAERRVLDQGAYALALRLYAVVAVLVLVMALAGLFVSTAVQLPARRRDAAALRVVGVPRRAVMSAVVRELAVVLGGAAVAGILAGSLAQYVVLRTITLGYVEDIATPQLVAAISPLRLVVLAAIAAVVFGAVALASAGLTVRGARGATLRESAR